MQSIRYDACHRNAPKWVVKRCLAGKVLRRDSEYWVCSCKHWQWIPCKVAVPNSKETNSKRVAKNRNGVDGKRPRGPLLSDWVGKVLGKPFVEPPGKSDDPVTNPIDEEDDAVETGQAGKQDDTNVDASDKVALLESQIAHLKRAPIQTSVLSGMVEQLESELSAALVERRESWPLWRQARRHQRQIDDSRMKLALLEDRELEVLGKMDSLHQESCAIHESKQKLLRQNRGAGS